MNNSITVDRDLIDMMAQVFAAQRDRQGTESGPATWDLEFWTQLDELGLTALTTDEESGGTGAGWAEAAELIRAAAGNGVRIPVGEHDLLANRVLAEVGLPISPARRTVALLDADGVARAVPWAAAAERVVLIWPDGDGYLACDGAAESLHVTPGWNLAGEPRDTVAVTVTGLDGTRVPEAIVTALQLRGALLRALQICAALDRIQTLCVEHTTSRVQFGRPLSKFQAVQHLVADIAAEASLARAATEAALAEAVATDWAGERLPLLIAVARSCAGHAASVVVRNAHQVHGAIGTTREHRLHEFTRPVMAWRSEFGSVQYWDDQLTAAALEVGGEGLWELLTG